MISTYIDIFMTMWGIVAIVWGIVLSIKTIIVGVCDDKRFILIGLFVLSHCILIGFIVYDIIINSIR